MLNKILNIAESRESRYQKFIESKKVVAEEYGFRIEQSQINPICKPHQKDIIQWVIRGARRAVFASFGLGKTIMELEVARIVSERYNKPYLIAAPLAVQLEFFKDAKKLGIEIHYVTDSSFVRTNTAGIYITNYERIRTGNFAPEIFCGISMDEASVLRGLDTVTVDYIMTNFKIIPFRSPFTATPSPNEFTELLNYADFLGVMDRGQALTRFFQRDSQLAGNLTLYPHKEEEFWHWVSTWAVFITKPSDLGYDDTGYDLPKLNVVYHKVELDRGEINDREGNTILFRNSARSLVEASKEKKESIPARVEKMMEIINSDDTAPSPSLEKGGGHHWLLWHHREEERKQIEKVLPEAKTVYGAQDMETREDYLMGFAEGKYKYLATKPSIAGSGSNFQYFCSRAIFVGVDYDFNDFIQAVHRIYRFMQTMDVTLHIIHTDAETGVIKTLLKKWRDHEKLVKKMTGIIKKYGLNKLHLQEDIKRSMSIKRKDERGESFIAYNNDAILETFGWKENSVGLIVSSIPFGNHYEYCESFYDAGHNDGDKEFFEQLGYLTENLYKVLQPGRICAIHVKDRIRYGYQNQVGFISLNDFSGKTVNHFEKFGFHLMGKITVTTDVVRENNQTYRLGYTENCKDGTKMGVGLPEYVLIFRKPQTDRSNSYADLPVIKSKDDYSLGKWQLDAHSYWRSNGNRLLSEDEIKNWNLSQIGKHWKHHSKNNIYDFNEHVELCDMLSGKNKLPTTFMAVPPHSNSQYVWDNVNRMNTLNSSQARRNQEKHICPLQFDIVDRCIERWSNPGEVVLDPFAGIFTVPYRAILKGRFGIGIELNEVSWKDGVKYCREAERKENAPTLFDMEAVNA